MSAGEVSGDIHGARLALALRELRPEINLVGWGSHRMADAGVEIIGDMVPHAAVGLTENLSALVWAGVALRQMQSRLRREHPAALVLIDYQGANMRLARIGTGLGIRVVYYISPQEWLWGFRGGTKKVARWVDRILCVFDGEAKAYALAGAKAVYLGHPILDQAPDALRLEALRNHLGLKASQIVLGVFPGSREVEVRRLLPLMLAAAKTLRGEIPLLRVLLPLASSHFRLLVAELVSRAPAAGVEVIEEASGIEILALCRTALVASGTVTLEAAVVETPVVASYRVSAFTAFVARRVFKIGHVTLPNILLGRFAIPELLQEQATAGAMVAALRPLVAEGAERDKALADLRAVRALLGRPGATRRAAQEVLEVAGLA